MVRFPLDLWGRMGRLTKIHVASMSYMKHLSVMKKDKRILELKGILPLIF